MLVKPRFFADDPIECSLQTIPLAGQACQSYCTVSVTFVVFTVEPAVPFTVIV
jgi:hypothetical protein